MLGHIILTILKVAGMAIIVYLVFAFVASTVACMGHKNVAAPNREALSAAAAMENRAPDKVTLIETTTDAFNVRQALLASATTSIDIAYHAIDEGASSNALVYELIAAAERGVKVRLLLDGKLGAPGDITMALSLAALHENIEYRIYNKLHLLVPWKWHYVLHDKFFIIDNQYLLLGGRNIGDRYFDPANYSSPVTHDRDVLVERSSEPGLSVLDETLAYMEELWNSPDVSLYKPSVVISWAELSSRSYQFKRDNPDFYAHDLAHFLDRGIISEGIYLITNPIEPYKKEPTVVYHMMEQAMYAKHSVLIQTPYATANPYLLAGLRMIDCRADLQIQTNSIASSPNFPAFSNYYSQRHKFLRTGATIYEYQSTDSLHAKSMVIDDQISFVGSLNLDDRSMYLDTESMLVIKSEDFSILLRQTIGSYQNNSLVVGNNNQYLDSEHVEKVPVSFIKQVMMWITAFYSCLLQFLV